MITVNLLKSKYTREWEPEEKDCLECQDCGYCFIDGDLYEVLDKNGKRIYCDQCLQQEFKIPEPDWCSAQIIGGELYKTD